MEMIDRVSKHPHSPEKDYSFSILIPTWNNLDYLALCVSSIRKHSSLNVQIIVFVNHGEDGTIAWLKEQGDIDYLHAEENVGICFALNLCRSMVKSSYIVFLNDDMYVLPNWDTVLAEEINKLSTKAFMLSGTMIEPTETGNPCVVVRDYGEDLESFQEEKLLEEYAGLTRSDWNGSTWPPNVVHVDLWDMVGGMSIEYSPGMYSDPDLSKKLYEAGVRIFKGVGTSLVYHFGSRSTRKLRRPKGKLQFLMKWGLTSNAFGKAVLKRGARYQKLPESVSLTKAYRIGNLKILLTLLRGGKKR